MPADLLAREEIRLLLLLMSPFLLIAALLILIWAVGLLRFRRKRRTWQSTSGRILRSEVHDDGDNGYYPYVAYSYTVAGTRYEADRLALGVTMTKGNRDNPEIQQRLAAYPVGGQVTVHYNPRNPAKAVLEMQARANRGLLFSAILILLIVGIFSSVWILAADPDSFLQPLLAQLDSGSDD